MKRIHPSFEQAERGIVEQILYSFIGSLINIRPVAEVRSLIQECADNDALWDVIAGVKPQMQAQITDLVKGEMTKQ